MFSGILLERSGGNTESGGSVYSRKITARLPGYVVS